jgi:hypothetical protein
MTKRKSIKKTLDRKIYVAKATPNKSAPRKAVVDEVRAVLMQPQFRKLQKHIERISITKGGNSANRVTTGRVITDKTHKKKPVYKIFDYDGFDTSYYRSVAVHELAHIHWGVKQKWDNDAWTKFNKVANSLRPVNEYLEMNEHKWRRDTRFGTTANQYCNESHSAAAELYYAAEQTRHTYQFPADQRKLVAAYRELHNLQ